MIAPLDELQACVLQLAVGDRARLAEVLIASLDDDAEIEAAWWVEADRFARREFDAALSFYEMRSKALSAECLEAVNQVIALICERPGYWQNRL